MQIDLEINVDTLSIIDLLPMFTNNFGVLRNMFWSSIMC